MALGIVSDDIFEQELEKFLAPVIIQPKSKVREGERVPDSIRKVIGDTRLEGGPSAGTEMAELFGLTAQAARAYSTGSTSFSEGPAKNLGPHIAKTKERIAKKAGRLAIHAINAITDEKLAEAKAGELANVARAASSIVKDMSPESDSNKPAQLTQIILHAPKMANEEKYQTIDVISTEVE